MKTELVKVINAGNKNLVNFQIYGNDVDDPEKAAFTWSIIINGNKTSWNDVSENAGGFYYDSVEEAEAGMMDYFVDHFLNVNNISIEEKIYLDEMENPEDNVEEVPEDYPWIKK